MSKNNNLISINGNGEFLYPALGTHVKKLYKADTPMDRSFVPYLIMAICATIDAAVFINLFKLISYDNPLLLGIQIAGFLFAFDVVPLFIGIQTRRIKQGITKDKFILWIALSVCVIACVLNIILRLMTVEEMTPALSSSMTSFIGNASEGSPVSGSSVDPATLALCIFGMIMPMLTSLGSFFISYITYNPLSARKKILKNYSL